ncbi:MAG: hypothetical protein R3324_12575 [Halobacteriales archaeon]|nr:hypothetical protein [Halobacteriales archaeon]
MAPATSSASAVPVQVGVVDTSQPEPGELAGHHLIGAVDEVAVTGVEPHLYDRRSELGDVRSVFMNEE